MAKTLVIKDSTINELVLGGKHYHTYGNDEKQIYVPQNKAEDVEFEEIAPYCSYLNIEGIKKAGIWTVLQVQKTLEEKSQKDVNEFVEFLRDYEKKDYLNFLGHSKRQVFRTLRAELPMMRKYSESNFYSYF